MRRAVTGDLIDRNCSSKFFDNLGTQSFDNSREKGRKYLFVGCISPNYAV